MKIPYNKVKLDNKPKRVVQGFPYCTQCGSFRVHLICGLGNNTKDKKSFKCSDCGKVVLGSDLRYATNHPMMKRR